VLEEDAVGAAAAAFERCRVCRVVVGAVGLPVGHDAVPSWPPTACLRSFTRDGGGLWHLVERRPLRGRVGRGSWTRAQIGEPVGRSQGAATRGHSTRRIRERTGHGSRLRYPGRPLRDKVDFICIVARRHPDPSPTFSLRPLWARQVTLARHRGASTAGASRPLAPHHEQGHP